MTRPEDGGAPGEQLEAEAPTAHDPHASSAPAQEAVTPAEGAAPSHGPVGPADEPASAVVTGAEPTPSGVATAPAAPGEVATGPEADAPADPPADPPADGALDIAAEPAAPAPSEPAPPARTDPAPDAPTATLSGTAVDSTSTTPTTTAASTPTTPTEVPAEPAATAPGALAAPVPVVAGARADRADRVDGSERDDRVDDRVDDGPARPRSSRRGLRIALAAAALALLVGVLVLGWLWRGSLLDERAREQALTAARQSALNLTSIDGEDFDGDVGRVLDGATGEFRTDFSGRVAELQKLVEENEVSAEGRVLEAGLVRSDRKSATALVVVDSRIRNTAVPEGRVNSYRMRLELERVGDEWRTSSLEFVG